MIFVAISHGLSNPLILIIIRYYPWYKNKDPWLYSTIYNTTVNVMDAESQLSFGSWHLTIVPPHERELIVLDAIIMNSNTSEPWDNITQWIGIFICASYLCFRWPSTAISTLSILSFTHTWMAYDFHIICHLLSWDSRGGATNSYSVFITGVSHIADTVLVGRLSLPNQRLNEVTSVSLVLVW